MTIEFEPRYRLTWHASPLDEKPEVVLFDLWDEMQDWIQDKEDSVDCFDLDLCHIEDLQNAR